MSPRAVPVVVVLYAVLAGGLALAGAVAGSPLYYVAAVVVTLPVGLAAFVGMYGGYALIAGVGGLFVSTTTDGGDWSPWLRDATAILGVLLFAGAALGNVWLLRQLRSTRRASPPRPVDHVW